MEKITFQLEFAAANFYGTLLSLKREKREKCVFESEI